MMQNTALSSETEAALERLNSLPSQFVPDRLRASVLDVASGQAAHRKHSEEVAAVSLAARSAGELGDVSAASLAASRLAGLEQVRLYLPSVELDPAAVTEALDNARELVRLARGNVRPALAVEYTLECEAWSSLAGLDGRIIGGAPEPLDTDRAARSVAAAHNADVENLVKAIAIWNVGQGDVINLLTIAADLIRQCQSVAERSVPVNAQVRAANLARRSSGLNWPLPGSYSSLACATLRQFRALAAQEV